MSLRLLNRTRKLLFEKAASSCYSLPETTAAAVSPTCGMTCAFGTFYVITHAGGSPGVTYTELVSPVHSPAPCESLASEGSGGAGVRPRLRRLGAPSDQRPLRVRRLLRVRDAQRLERPHPAAGSEV